MSRTTLRPRIGIDARKWNDGGIGTYVREIARRLPAAMPEAGGFVAFVSPAEEDELRRELDGFDVAVLAAASYSPTGPFALARAWERSGLDLLHAPHWTVPARAAGALVTTIHDAIQLDPRFFPLHRRLLARAAIRFALRTSTATITVSRAAKEELVRQIGPVAEGLSVVANGASLPLDEPVSRREERVRRWIGEARPRHFLLAVANHRPHKGLRSLLGALARVPHRDGWGLLLVGAEGEGTKIAEMTSELLPPAWQEATIVRPRAPREVVDALYHLAAALVVPSFAEGFGLPLVEAMAAGATLVASDIPPHRETAGEIPFYFPPGDEGALAGLLEAIVFDRIESGPHRAAGIIHARSFSWDECARRTVEIYRIALEKRKGGA